MFANIEKPNLLKIFPGSRSLLCHLVAATAKLGERVNGGEKKTNEFKMYFKP